MSTAQHGTTGAHWYDFTRCNRRNCDGALQYHNPVRNGSSSHGGSLPLWLERLRRRSVTGPGGVSGHIGPRSVCPAIPLKVWQPSLSRSQEHCARKTKKVTNSDRRWPVFARPPFIPRPLAFPLAIRYALLPIFLKELRNDDVPLRSALCLYLRFAPRSPVLACGRK